jgi:hypothetical protein
LLFSAPSGLIRHIHGAFPANISAQRDNPKTKFGFLAPLSNKYAVTLLLISMTGALAGLLIDFQFYAAAASASMGSKGNANFFANFYILLNFSSLLLQLFATPENSRQSRPARRLDGAAICARWRGNFRHCRRYGVQPLRIARH